MKTNDIETIYPLSPMQQGLLFHSLYAPETRQYLGQLSCRLYGSLDVNAFQQAWQMAVDRHAIFRSAFAWKKIDQTLQIVLRSVQLPFLIEDLTSLPEDQQQQRIAAYLQADRQRSFDLSRPPLMRNALFALAPDTYQLIWTHHHIIIDGWSLGQMIGEVMLSYELLRAGQPVDVPSSRPFRDYIAWLQQQDLSKKESFWRNYLKGFREPTHLAIDHSSRGSRMDVDGAPGEIERALSPEVSQAVMDLARSNGLTVSVILQGAYAILLSRYSRDHDIVFGTTFSGRSAPLAGIENIVGNLINTLPTRVLVDPQASLLPWLHEIQARQAELAECEHCPLTEIQRWSEVPHDLPLFESLFVFENYPIQFEPHSETGLRLELIQSTERTNFPLALIAAARDGLVLKIVYDPARIDQEAAERLLGHMETLLQSMTGNPKERLSSYNLLTPGEEQQILVEWNQTAAPFPESLRAHELFKMQAERNPLATALEFDTGAYSYQDLDDRSTRLACWLKNQGVGPETIIAVLFNRSPEMITAMLGILKAGAAFLPMDTSYPQDRLAFMLSDSGAAMLLTETACLSYLPTQPELRKVLLDTEWQTISQSEEDPNIQRAQPDHLAYIIYTSGTTGRPKGVLLEHRGLTNLVTCQARDYRIGPGKRVLQFASPAFDAAVAEIFTTLCSGGTLILARKEILTSPNDLTRFMQERHIHNVTLPPSLLAILPGDNLPDLEVIISAGEALPLETANRWVTGRCLINGYGPTEGTVAAAWYITDQAISGLSRVPIGRPIANTCAYVLNEAHQPVPVGVPGELYIGGAGLARGYLNRPDLTQEKFLLNPFQPGSRLYKTGDLVQWLPDGSLDFLGRVDFQVKLRGFRIELGEIENVLCQHPGVAQATVVVLERDDSQSLIAYLVPGQPGNTPAPETLRSFLKEQLPEYMLPAAYMWMEALPLNPSGKIDRKILPVPEGALQPGLNGSFFAPRTQTETFLAETWSYLLHLPRVSRRTNFFDAGGHSLLAMRVMARVHEVFQIDLPIRVLFERPVLEDFAAQIDQIFLSNSQLSAEQIQPAPRNGEIPLSFQQQRLWFLDQLDPGNFSYNLPAAVRLRGHLDIEMLQQSLQAILGRHEALRTNFIAVDGRPIQVTQSDRALDMQVVDLTNLPIEEREPAAVRMAQENNNRPFDLATDILLRAAIYRLSEEEHILALTLHHIIADGWSLGVMIREITALYTDKQHSTDALPALPIQYPDFSYWQRQRLQGEILDQHLSYWKQQLNGLPPLLELPTDRPRPSIKSYHGDLVHFTINEEMTNQLRKFGSQQKATLYMILLAVYQVLLFRYSGQEDIAVGTAVASRTRREVENLIGFFVNTLVLRGNLSGEPTFQDLLKSTRKVCLEAYTHQDLPFELLVDALDTERNTSHSPLFQAAFDLQTPDDHLPQLPGLNVEPLAFHNGTTSFDLLLSFTDHGKDILGTLEYSSDLFDPHTAQQMINQFQVLLEAVLADPKRPVTRLPMLTAAETHLLLDEWNDTEHAFESESCAHQLFEAWAQKQPDQPALIFEGQQLSYSALNRRANALAARLNEQGVGPESIVGIFGQRGFELITAVLAVLKAGAAYVPLDPAYPSDRLAFMLADSQAALLLAQPHLVDQLPEHSAPVMVIEEGQLVKNPACRIRPDSLAYVIYTSGSTGRPKGTLLKHEGICSLVAFQQQAFDILPGTRVLQFSSLSFDASVWEIFMTLGNGGTLVLAPQETLASPTDLQNLLIKERVNIVTLPPTMIQAFSPAHLPDLKIIVAAGEACPAELVRAWGSGRRFFNAYGPTETTVCASMALCSHDDPLPPSIGKPIYNTHLYVLDPYRELLPPGVPGELYVGGVSVALGYLRRPELTAERFMVDPFSRRPGERMYKTGDRVRWRADGNLEFLDRIDNQVKLRGFRIELGEIEATLQKYPAIRQAVVVVREDTPGQPRLVAYLVPAQPEDTPDPALLRAFVKDSLPDYMVPAIFAFLDVLPLTPNGKVDRKRLPRPIQAATTRPWQGPRNETEQAVADICCDLLKIERVSVDDSFFELGGHSLLATQFISRIRDRFSVDIPLKWLFEHSTIADLAGNIDRMKPAQNTAAVSISDLMKFVEESSSETIQEMIVPNSRIQGEDRE